MIDIQVMPNAGKTCVEGLYGIPGEQALKVRLNASPVEGKANEALLKWLAATLGIAQKSLVLVRGKTSRRKQVCVSSGAVAMAKWPLLLPPVEKSTGP